VGVRGTGGIGERRGSEEDPARDNRCSRGGFVCARGLGAASGGAEATSWDTRPDLGNGVNPGESKVEVSDRLRDTGGGDKGWPRSSDGLLSMDSRCGAVSAGSALGVFRNHNDVRLDSGRDVVRGLGSLGSIGDMPKNAGGENDSLR